MIGAGERLLEKIRGDGAVNQADFFDVGILAFTDEVRKMCEQNTCGRFGRAWNCPPVCGTVEELEAACRQFGKGILVNTVKRLEDSFDWEGMQAGGRALAELTERMNGLAQECGLSDYRIFGGGGCHGCKECSYPDTPCRHPDALFTPIEACGINVVELAKGSGFQYNNGQNTVTFFGMILYNE